MSPQVSSASKTERLLNLLIMLLVQRNYVSKERIRAILYADASDDAFEKMFERDKDELRSLGVPIEVGQMDAYFDDEPGYRIRADEFALPEISLESDEASVVALATKVWEHARLAEATTDAVSKLSAAGLALDLAALDIAQPRLSADEPAFDVFWEATVSRRPVTFDYQRPGYDAPLTRHLAALGRRTFLRTLVRRRTRHRSRRGAGLPPLPGGRPGEGDRCSRARSTSRRAPTSAPSPDVWLPRRRPRRRSSWSGPAPEQCCGEPRRRSSPTSTAPTSRPRGIASTFRAARRSKSCSALGPDVYVEQPESLRTEVVTRLRAAAGAFA